MGETVACCRCVERDVRAGEGEDDEEDVVVVASPPLVAAGGMALYDSR